jgi:multidrug efflux pump subunit AcrA (membrane-fusion protein)
VDLRIETPVEGTDDEGAPLAPRVTYTTVSATASGSVAGLDLVTGQPVEIGDVVARVAPDAFRVVATLEAAQLYRLSQRPTEATVSITDGPAPFTCTNLSLASLASSASGDAADAAAEDGSDSSGGTQLSCDVPADVTVFPGLEVTIAVPAGSAKGVLVLPTTAVEGSAEKGVVTVVDETGARSERDVVLGLNDGTSVEIAKGLAEGDEVLEFVPGKAKIEDPEGDLAGDGVMLG